ncbi:beta-hexosaminidase subunit beta-like [Mytilus galloprovincialis]|uniref:beta-hexosaminidase subunit beta-like n=1 Tax=Mytilus galloprovincialis TaxID=29158 RepID=UPI003F7C5AC7
MSVHAYMYIVILTLSGFFYAINGHITYIAIRLPLQGNRSEPGSPWPTPETMKKSSTILTANPETLTFMANLASCDIIKDAMSRYKNIIKMDTKKADVDINLVKMKSLSIDIKDNECPGYPQLNMNESYNLTVDESSTLSAVSVWGVLRGLETFSQLIYVNEQKKIQVKKTSIEDRPRFKHRGIMLDTARHYLPIWILLKNLDAMSYNKFNVFHWHIVDDQSFPYQSKRFPGLSAKGAYTAKHVYTHVDIKRVIDYARLRGIRVIPEFDTPGHTASWGKARKDLLTPCYENGIPGVGKYNSHGEYEILNPTLNRTYKFMEELLGEVVEVFHDNFVHLGMDEAYHACWATNPEISKFMVQNGIAKGDYSALEEYYIEKVLKIVDSLNRSDIIWQDPIDHGAKVPQNAIIQIWKGSKNTAGTWEEYMTNITNQGHQVILSSCWYLNYISYGQDWKKYYQCDPLNFSGSDNNFEKVLGGEACVFGEYIDHTNLLPRLWPRASAAGERLWSSNDVIQDVESAAFRLDEHRCRMLKRGIPAQPILNGYCGEYELEEQNDRAAQTESKTSCTTSSSMKNNYSGYLTLLCIILSYTVLCQREWFE